MLEVDQLGKSYGDVVAVRDVSFHINKGEAFGLLGAFNAILLMLTPLAALSYPKAIVLAKNSQEAGSFLT